MLLCGSIDDNSTTNTVRLGSTSCVPGTISTAATLRGANIAVTGFKRSVTGDVCSCRSGFQVTFPACFCYDIASCVSFELQGGCPSVTVGRLKSVVTAESDGHMLSQWLSLDLWVLALEPFVIRDTIRIQNFWWHTTPAPESIVILLQG